jgi:hypothetical protein
VNAELASAGAGTRGAYWVPHRRKECSHLVAEASSSALYQLTTARSWLGWMKLSLLEYLTLTYRAPRMSQWWTRCCCVSSSWENAAGPCTMTRLPYSMPLLTMLLWLSVGLVDRMLVLPSRPQW